MHRLLMTLLLITVGMLGCTPKAGPNKSEKDTDAAAAKAAILALNHQWETAFKNKDAAGLANLFTDDCVRMPNGAATSVGRQGLEAAYRQEFAEVWKTKFDESIKTDEVVVS